MLIAHCSIASESATMIAKSNWIRLAKADLDCYLIDDWHIASTAGTNAARVEDWISCQRDLCALWWTEQSDSVVTDYLSSPFNSLTLYLSINYILISFNYINIRFISLLNFKLFLLLD